MGERLRKSCFAQRPREGTAVRPECRKPMDEESRTGINGFGLFRSEHLRGRIGRLNSNHIEVCSGRQHPCQHAYAISGRITLGRKEL